MSIILQITYHDILETTFMKRKWLSYVGARWRDFKSKLTTKYVFSEMGNESDDYDNNKNGNFEKPLVKCLYILTRRLG